MIEYLASLYFGVILWFLVQHDNTCPSFEVKVFELLLLMYITIRNPLLGIVCAMIYIKHCTIEGCVTIAKQSSRIYVDEQLRASQSNTFSVERQTGLPPQESLIGQMAKPYSQLPSKYTPF
jgi:hypothetical protein